MPTDRGRSVEVAELESPRPDEASLLFRGNSGISDKRVESIGKVGAGATREEAPRRRTIGSCRRTAVGQSRSRNWSHPDRTRQVSIAAWRIATQARTSGGGRGRGTENENGRQRGRRRIRTARNRHGRASAELESPRPDEASLYRRVEDCNAGTNETAKDSLTAGVYDLPRSEAAVSRQLRD
jgi:hypothetical protein